MSMNNIKKKLNFDLKNEYNIKLGFFNPLIGMVNVFSEEIIST